jgi:hypothetical protein
MESMWGRGHEVMQDVKSLFVDHIHFHTQRLDEISNQRDVSLTQGDAQGRQALGVTLICIDRVSMLRRAASRRVSFSIVLVPIGVQANAEMTRERTKEVEGVLATFRVFVGGGDGGGSSMLLHVLLIIAGARSATRRVTVAVATTTARSAVSARVSMERS